MYVIEPAKINVRLGQERARDDRILTILPSDASNQAIHLFPESLILFHVRSGGHGNLDKDYLADPFGIFGKKSIESVQLLWYSLDVVHTINSNHNLNVFELLAQGRYIILYLGCMKAVMEFTGINTDRKCAGSDISSLKMDALLRRVKSPAVPSAYDIKQDG